MNNLEALLKLIETDKDFKRILINEEFKLVSMVANMAQWNKIESLWDAIADRCRAEKRGVNKDETLVLEDCIYVYNLTRSNYKADLVTANVNDYYDYETQQQGNIGGDKIKSTWLPGLRNPGGELVRRTIVETY